MTNHVHLIVIPKTKEITGIDYLPKKRGPKLKDKD